MTTLIKPEGGIIHRVQVQYDPSHSNLGGLRFLDKKGIKLLEAGEIETNPKNGCQIKEFLL